MIFHFCLLCTVSFPLLLAKQRFFCLYRGPIKLPVLKGTLPPLPLPARSRNNQEPDLAWFLRSLIKERRDFSSFIYFIPQQILLSTYEPTGFGTDAELPQFLRPRLAWCLQSERPRSFKRLKNKISICSIWGLFQQLLGKGLCTPVT